jgi:hypothetical protein
VATAGDRERSRQLPLDASEEVDGVREWDGAPRRCLGVGRVVIGAGAGARSTDSEWRHDTAVEADLAPL